MRKIIAVVGPTAAGKTGVSIALAESVDGEVVSADSRQVYRGLDVGSGKITREEMRDIPHHLLDVADPKDIFSAAEYAERGRAAISEIAARGRVPIVAGGSGFYIDALVGNTRLADAPPDESLRLQLSAFSLEQLNATLAVLDPERYATIDANNPRRLVRAIEIARFTRSRAESSNLKAQSSFNVLWVGIALPKESLHEKIHARLFARIREQGMLDEAKKLHAEGLSYERMETLGLEYRFMGRHLQGKISRDEMVSRLETEIKKYAKRQMTWFKRNKDIRWFSPAQTPEIIALAKDFLAKN